MSNIIGPPRRQIYNLDCHEVNSLPKREICYIVSIGRNELYIGNNRFSANEKTYRAAFEQRQNGYTNCYFPDYFKSYKYRWYLLESLPPNWRVYSDGQITNLVPDEIAKSGSLTWSVVIAAGKYVVDGNRLFREEDYE